MFSHAIRHLSDTAPGALPYDAEVEYIESSGTQYIDTGIVVSESDNITRRMKFEYTGLSSNARNSLDGSYSGSANARDGFLSTTYTETYMQLAIGSTAYLTSITRSSLVDNALDLVCVINGSAKTVSLTNAANGTSYYSGSYSGSIQTGTSACICCRSSAGSTPGEYSSVRIYRYMIAVNGTVVRDMIPVRVGGEYCLYDKANPTGGTNGDGLYHNAGSGVFTGGSDKAKAQLPYDAEVEYIESTGTQYIDTGVIPNQNTSAQMRVMNLAVTGDVIFGYMTGNDQNDWRFFNYNTRTYMDIFTGRCYSEDGNFNANTWYEFEVGNLYVKNLLTGTTVASGTTLTSFTGVSTITLNKYSASTTTYSKNKWAWVKIYDNGILVRDLIPVRVGTEYCLYDRTNPTGGDNGDGLYHNKGTGAFLGGVDKPKAGTKFLASKVMGDSSGKIKPVLKHYDMAVKYRIDECNGNLQTIESVNFPSGKYTALDYTPTYDHHRFVGWQNSSQDGEAEFLDSLPTGYTYPDGGNVMLTGVHPGPNTSFEIKARALNQTMTNMYGLSGVAAANGECRWGCDETIDGVRTRYFINVNIGGWSSAQAFYNVNNNNGNYVDFKYKSTDIGIFGYDASSKTVYTKTDANVVVNSTVLPDETTIKQFTGEFKFFGCPANSSAVSTTASLTCRPARLYYAKFWESGVLIRDYVPYVKDGVACLLDKVSGTFLYNYGTGIMMGGPLKATPVEYVESDGTQYVDTGIVPTGATGVDCDFALLNPTQNFSPVFWSRGSSATDRAYCFEGETAGGYAKGQARWDYGSYGPQQVQNVIEQGVRTTASVRSGTLTVGATTLARNAQTFTGAGSIILFNFCNYVNGERQMLSAACQPIRIYSFTIYDGSTLVRDFIPMRVGQAGYLYDKVSGRLFGSETGTPLIAGPDTGPFIAPSDNIIYDAKLISAVWQSPTTVTFDATTNGGQMPSGWTAPDYYEGQPYGTLPTPTHATLNFTGWYINGSKVIATDLVQANATLVAQYAASSYSVDISNGDWVLQDPNTNPDASAYDGVYQSDRYHGSPPSSGCVVKMYVDVIGYVNFKIYIRSNAEVNYSYVIAVNPDVDPSTYTEAINNQKAATSADNSGTAISAYTEVNYALDGGSHRICVCFIHKDGIQQNDDRGYLLIPKVQ